MKMPNFSNGKNAQNFPKNAVKTIAEYKYIKKEKDGKIKEKKFVSNLISTIDIPYGKYTLR